MLKIAVSKRFWPFPKMAPFSLFLEILLWEKNELELSKKGVLNFFCLAPFRIGKKGINFESGALGFFVGMAKKR